MVHYNRAMSMQLSALHVFPVKSCAALVLDEAQVEPRGLAHDRRWMVVDDADRFITGREEPRLVLLRAQPVLGGLLLSAPGMSELQIAQPVDGRGDVTVWRDRVNALHAPAQASEWVTLAVKPGQTLSEIFESQGVGYSEAIAVTQLSRDSARLKSLRAGDRLSLRVSPENRLEELRFELDETNTLQIRRTADDQLEAITIAAELEARQTQASGIIENSLFLDGQRAGIFRRCDAPVFIFHMIGSLSYFANGLPTALDLALGLDEAALRDTFLTSPHVQSIRLRAIALATIGGTIEPVARFGGAGDPVTPGVDRRERDAQAVVDGGGHDARQAAHQRGAAAHQAAEGLTRALPDLAVRAHAEDSCRTRPTPTPRMSATATSASSGSPT